MILYVSDNAELIFFIFNWGCGLAEDRSLGMRKAGGSINKRDLPVM